MLFAFFLLRLSLRCTPLSLYEKVTYLRTDGQRIRNTFGTRRATSSKLARFAHIWGLRANGEAFRRANCPTCVCGHLPWAAALSVKWFRRQNFETPPSQFDRPSVKRELYSNPQHMVLQTTVKSSTIILLCNILQLPEFGLMETRATA